MLRVSAQVTEKEIDIALVNGQGNEDSGIQYGNELMHFAESVASMDEAGLTAAREALFEAAGPDVLVDAAGVAANFQRMVRIADSMGIPVDSSDNEVSNEIRESLDLYRFKSAENSASVGR